MPEWWHKLESWLTLVWEILVPFAIFGPRRVSSCCDRCHALFQLINISTANYGFFSYLALALNVALLDEHDLQTLRARLRAWLKKPRRPLLTPSETSPSAPPEHATPPQADEQSLPMTVSTERLRTLLHGALFTLYFAVSALDGLASFALKREDAPFASERALLSRFRVANTYHLFGHITRDRVEPEFQVSVDGVWEPLSMHYKPGPVDRAPPFVAPHQPRIDFLLWFYGLSFRQGMPEYVGSLMKKLCVDPKVVSPLFVEPLPDAPEAVRVVFSRYHFTSSANHTGSSPQAWWERTDDVSGRAFACGPLRSQPHLHP
ncbi:MAG: lipase maturation factor family protein [Polyangiaceae bacterium]